MKSKHLAIMIALWGWSKPRAVMCFQSIVVTYQSGTYDLRHTVHGTTAPWRSTRFPPFHHQAHKIASMTFLRSSSSSYREGKNDDGGKSVNTLGARSAVSAPMNPLLQMVVALVFYVFHLTVLSQHGIAFPFQLIPNDDGKYQSVGYDTLAGMATLVGYVVWRRSDRGGNDGEPPHRPWNLDPRTHSAPGLRVLTLLLFAYTQTGKTTPFFEALLYLSLDMGARLTQPMFRSLLVLLGHWTWVGVGCTLLRLELRPFFNTKKSLWGEKRRRKKQQGWWSKQRPNEGVSDITGNEGQIRKTKSWWWYTNQWRGTDWVWWTVGGYYVSSFLFNMADGINEIFLPSSIFDAAEDGVVSQLINPEHNDFLASVVGCIAPCLSAPWWEEILYRGFLLPCLCLHMNFMTSCIVSALIFSVHHMSLTGFVPLATLGFVWAILYSQSRNLLVTILVHGMWNSRVFLGSWFGL